MRVGGLAWMHEGKLGRDRLAHDDRALFLEPLNDVGIPKRHASGIPRTAVSRGNARSVYDVFEAHRQPVQTPQWAACAAMCIHRAGLRADEFGIEPCPCANIGLARFN